MPFDLKRLIESRRGENYTLHERHMNRTLVAVQRAIRFDKVYTRAEGAYLYDAEGNDYLDFISGFGVYGMGRNHPALKQAIRDTLDLDLPNMVQLDSALLSGLLAEALTQRLAKQGAGHLDSVFLCNSGTEAVEGAIKFARAATGRPRIITLVNSYHGLTYGAMSATGNPYYHEGFGPFLPGLETKVEIGDIAALEHELKKGDVAGFMVEPVQGKTVKFPKDDFFNRAQALCRKHGTLFICDEVQTGLGRTGKWFAFEHWNLEPDLIMLAKALSGGYVPCGAIVTRRAIYQKTFSRMDRCIIHSTTFGRNNLACACGLASLAVIEEEGLVENAARMGAELERRLNDLKQKHSVIHHVRVKGLMGAIEFGEPKSLLGKAGWKFVRTLDSSMFPQLVVTPLLTQHRIIAQVAANKSDTLKFIPPLMIGQAEVDRFVNGIDDVLGQLGKFPGPIWELAKGFATAMKGNAALARDERASDVYAPAPAAEVIPEPETAKV